MLWILILSHFVFGCLMLSVGCVHRSGIFEYHQLFIVGAVLYIYKKIIKQFCCAKELSNTPILNLVLKKSALSLLKLLYCLHLLGGMLLLDICVKDLVLILKNKNIFADCMNLDISILCMLMTKSYDKDR